MRATEDLLSNYQHVIDELTFVMGAKGMPRRYFNYPPEFEIYHVLSSIGSYLMAVGFFVAAGVLGFAAVTARIPWLPVTLAWGGAVFLLAYGALRFRAAWRGSGGLVATGEAQSLRAAILTCLAFTWLNPHVYLDTLVLIGAISSGFHGAAKLAFGVGDLYE